MFLLFANSQEISPYSRNDGHDGQPSFAKLLRATKVTFLRNFFKVTREVLVSDNQWVVRIQKLHLGYSVTFDNRRCVVMTGIKITDYYWFLTEKLPILYRPISDYYRMVTNRFSAIRQTHERKIIVSCNYTKIRNGSTLVQIIRSIFFVIIYNE